MSVKKARQENFPQGGEGITDEVTLASRAPSIVMPNDSMWPMKLHDEEIFAAAGEALPLLVKALSTPIEPVSKDQIQAIFAKNPHGSRTPWRFQELEDGKYSYSREAYEGNKNPADGSTPLHYGINYVFDQKGRIVQFEYIDGDWSYDRGHPNYQEFLIYDEDGYLAERSTWSKFMHPPITDKFEYSIRPDGSRSLQTMIRTIKTQGGSFGYKDGEPMSVDLANYQEWLAKNPNGFTRVAKTELEPQDLVLKDFEVSEHRRGILFPHPEQLELALVMYGSGSYETPGGETALEHNDKVYAEGSALGGFLFSTFTRSQDMSEFVGRRIMDDVNRKWELVQKSRDDDASDRVHFSFDYDGAGHFHKTSGEVQITKTGLELTLGAAYVGDRVEDDLASALIKKRGLRSASIEIPVNQTQRDGYFLVDLQAVCERLGISVSDSDMKEFLGEYLGEGEFERSSYDRIYGKQPVLWQDAAHGIRVVLETQRKDYDADVDLDLFFGHDEASIWGPLPKDIRHLNDDGKGYTPKIKIIVEPRGNPHDEETTQRTDDIVRSYMMKLEKTNS